MAIKSRDLKRREVIRWCQQKQCDFKNPVLPPPEGWFWANSTSKPSERPLALCPIFTNSKDGDDLFYEEAYNLDGQA